MVLVTGSRGFIGERLISHLKKSGRKIKCVVRNNPGENDFAVNLGLEEFPFKILDSVESVFHLAGSAHDVHSMHQNNQEYRKLNVDSTLELAIKSENAGVKNFIFVSSVKAGGNSNDGTCNNELDQYQPQGIYAQSKLETEQKLLDFAKTFSMKITILRPALVYGPHVKGNLSQMRSAIKIGIFPPLPKIENKRSMIHVDDLVRALIFLEKDSRTNGEVYIATDGNPYSTREIYEAICMSLNKKIPSWTFPFSLIKFVSKISNKIDFKLNKLFGDECYSSAKLSNLGFKPSSSIWDRNAWSE